MYCGAMWCGNHYHIFSPFFVWRHVVVCGVCSSCTTSIIVVQSGVGSSCTTVPFNFLGASNVVSSGVFPLPRFGCILGSFREEMIIFADSYLNFTGMSQNQVPKIDFWTP